MKVSSIFIVLVSSLFLTAQAAVDAAKKNQIEAQVRPQVAAQQAAAQINEQKTVQTDQSNTSTIAGTVVQPQMTADLQLEGRILQQLRSNIKNFDPSKFMILSRNGEVTLQGNVKSQVEADQMENIAIKVSGVTRINNNLAVNVSN